MSNTMLDAMRAAGLAPHKDIEPIPDGRIHRYRVQGDKPGSTNGFYVLHESPVTCGAFGSWKTGETHTWREASRATQTPAERAELQRQLAAMRAARDAERDKVQAEARARAAKLWERARPATNAHPYLQRKNVGAYGLRQLRELLLIPARDAHGVLHTLQFIGADGAKRFLSGGKIAGCYCPIGRPLDSLLVCEGLATGSTLYAATGRAVAVAFSAVNLQPVASALRAKFPELKLIIVADNDPTPGNPGVTQATQAARAVGGLVAVPRFEGVAHD
ncbi:MAG: toprim domain-containing protein [Hydrogenophaga sp.]|jgi:putative DNA primase/helicase|nr:toprim domain-containing protein [Hydrogenophaga sp.]